jgi:hypothetical protein
MERLKGQAKTIRGWESSAFSKPSHGEPRKVQSKVDRALRDIKKTRPGAYKLLDTQGRILEHLWNAENLH